MDSMNLETNYLQNNHSTVNILRAVAILAVLGFHCYPSVFPLGYLGVDIFFVVSGFLVAFQITRQVSTISDAYVSVIGFWKKRIVRIYPSLIFTLIATIALSFFYGNFRLLQDVLAGSQSVIFGGLKFQSDNTVDYFDTSAQYKPLIHLWSLSIELQFYFLAPLAYFVFRFHKKIFFVFTCLSIVAVTSLKFFSIFEVSYYSSFLRFTQALCGFMIFGLYKKIRSKPILHGRAFLVGLFMLILFISNSFYIVFWSPILSLVFSILVSLLMLIGLGANYKPSATIEIIARKLGQSTLSIYLFHWVLIVFFKLHTTNDLTPTRSSLLFVVSILLGLMGREFIELRFNIKTPFILGKIALMICFTLFLSMLLMRGNLLSNELRNSRNSENSATFDFSIFDQQPCSFLNDGELLKNFCTEWNYGPSKSTVLIWGDSFSNAWMSAFLQNSTESKFRVIQISHAACPPLIGVVRKDKDFGFEWCDSGKLQKEVVANLGEMNLNQIFLISRWSLYTEGLFKKGKIVSKPFIYASEDTKSASLSTQIVFDRQLHATTKLLSSYAPVVIFMETPTMPIDLASAKPSERPFTLMVDFLDFTKISRDAISGINLKNTIIFDPSSKLCSETKCHSFSDQGPLYQDDAHPTHALVNIFHSEIKMFLNSD